MPPSILRIQNDPRDYAWGVVGGVSRAFGRPAGDRPEAELWLGAHPSSPARFVGDEPWPDLVAWEHDTGQHLPYLLKLLAAASPLSLQAHPTAAQALAGFDREQAAGIALDARERNYKDPNAKPELIVAVDDGFEALCGFREIAGTVALLEAATDVAGVDRLLDLLREPDGLRAATTWILGGGEDVSALVASVGDAAEADPDRWPLAAQLAREFPGDAGMLLALLLNRVTIDAGECLWLPAGNIHAYLHGTGVELMGASDNVLRGGLTPKHVDTVELERVLDFTGGPPPRLAPTEIASGVAAYRPSTVPSGEGIPFELLLVTADAHLDVSGPTIALLVDGAFDLVGPDVRLTLAPGDAVLVDRASDIDAFGAGRLFLATPVPA